MVSLPEQCQSRFLSTVHNFGPSIMQNKNSSYQGPFCDFRIHYSPDALVTASSSWCAHHGFSDLKTCNIQMPCTAISTISQDPDFNIMTAFLYVRTNDDHVQYQDDQPQSGSTNSPPSWGRSPAIKIDDANSKKTKLHVNTAIQEDKPDLGLLHLHRDRLAAAAEALGWRNLDCFVQDHGETSMKRIVYELANHISSLEPLPPSTLESRKVVMKVDRAGKIFTSSTVLKIHIDPSRSCILHEWMPPTLNITPCFDKNPAKVYLDTQPTRPSTLLTHKTSHRCVYTAARERAKIAASTPPTEQEVLIYNAFGEIMDGSVTTAYFRCNDTWITPAAICGPTIGVTRRLALEKGLCKQSTIEIEDLRSGEEIWLSNAVRGFFKGILVTDRRLLKRLAESEEVKLARLAAGNSVSLVAGGI